MENGKTEVHQDIEVSDQVFDRAHLARYTMNDAGLEREVIGLFLTQLDATADMIEQAATAADWRLWTHTLKGAAAAVGAWRLHSQAIALEALAFDREPEMRASQLRVLAASVAEFRTHIASAYPQLAA